MSQKVSNVNQKEWGGKHWIRDEKRFAIYLRDGLCCLYCGRDIESVVMSLDHLKCRSNSGSNSPRNLISCCVDCNSKRSDESWQDFVFENCENPETVIVKIKSQINKKIDVQAAKKILAERKLKEC